MQPPQWFRSVAVFTHAAPHVVGAVGEQALAGAPALPPVAVPPVPPNQAPPTAPSDAPPAPLEPLIETEPPLD